MTAEEKREIEREVDEALRQGALVAGKMGSGGRDVRRRVSVRHLFTSFINCAAYCSFDRPSLLARETCVEVSCTLRGLLPLRAAGATTLPAWR